MRESIKERTVQIESGEIPDGYAYTRVGIVPVDWKQSKLKKHIVEYTEKTTERNQYPVLTSSRKGLMLQSDYYSDQITTDDNIGYNIIPYGYIKYRSRSDDGHFVFNENNFIDKGIISYYYPVFSFSKDVNHDFLFALLNYTSYRQAYAFVEGTAQLVLSMKKLGELKYYLPPIAEQEKIAEILSQCDKVIELKQQLIEEERNRKKWLMQNLLDPDTGVRLPGFAGEWLQIPFGKVGAFSKGTGISNDDCKTGEFPCVKYGDIYMSYDESFAVPVSFTTAEIAALSPKVIKGALLFTASGEDRLEIGKCTVYLGNDSLAVGGDIVICTPNEKKYDSLFLAYQQNAGALIKQKSVLSQGYSIVHLYSEQVKKLKIRVPPTKEEQVAISTLLSTVDNKFWLLRQELAQWQQKKKALMQLLLTGIVRVSV